MFTFLLDSYPPSVHLSLKFIPYNCSYFCWIPFLRTVQYVHFFLHSYHAYVHIPPVFLSYIEYVHISLGLLSINGLTFFLNSGPVFTFAVALLLCLVSPSRRPTSLPVGPPVQYLPPPFPVPLRIHCPVHTPCLGILSSPRYLSLLLP
jgi:hypothetical protein